MRSINISNSKNRDAFVGFDLKKSKVEVVNVLPDGSQPINCRMLKSTVDTEPEVLLSRYESSIQALCDAIVKEDPELNMEQVGLTLSGTKKIYIGEDDKIIYSLKRQEVIYSPEGEEKAVRELVDIESNIANPEAPIRETGKLIPKSKAVRTFVFTRKYQIRHVSGLTYDFLYDMAKNLADKNAVMLVGGGPKGVSPLVLNGNGVSYRGFLEGRIEEDKYCLILHLTNLELKSVI